ncbi:hypothetical protein GQ457_05G026560 [Hibiscus cannabinus]
MSSPTLPLTSLIFLGKAIWFTEDHQNKPSPTPFCPTSFNRVPSSTIGYVVFATEVFLYLYFPSFTFLILCHSLMVYIILQYPQCKLINNALYKKGMTSQTTERKQRSFIEDIKRK